MPAPSAETTVTSKGTVAGVLDVLHRSSKRPSPYLVILTFGEDGASASWETYRREPEGDERGEMISSGTLRATQVDDRHVEIHCTFTDRCGFGDAAMHQKMVETFADGIAKQARRSLLPRRGLDLGG